MKNTRESFWIFEYFYTFVCGKDCGREYLSYPFCTSDKLDLMEVLLMQTKETMKRMEEILKKENSFVKSEIEGLSDLLWSMAARTMYPSGDELVKWFYSEIPAFDNRSPMDILVEDGEQVLFQYLNTLPS